MLTMRWILCAGLLWCLLAPCVVAAAGFDRVVVVSIDALHPDALTESAAPLTMAMLERGGLAKTGQSTVPPKTLVAHSAMMTGIGPDEGGRLSNDWAEGDPRVEGETLFHEMRRRGFRTGYFYSKPKLGFLVNDAVDEHAFSRDDAIDDAVRFLGGDGERFVFVHVSGLDIVGPQHGWLSPEYIEELGNIDAYLEPLYDALQHIGNFLLIITSDHAGHGTDHGGDHPEEARVVFGAVSDRCEFLGLKGLAYRVTDLPAFVQQAVDGREGE